MNENTPSDPSQPSSFETGKAHVIQAAEELYSAASEKAAHYCAQAEEAYKHARERARTAQQEGEAYVREKPIQAVLAALGVGFILGLLIRR